CQAPTPESPDEVADLARSLLPGGPRAVVVTLGADGAMVVTADGVARVPAVPVRAVDATAAGDRFCAGLVARLLAREPPAAAAAPPRSRAPGPGRSTRCPRPRTSPPLPRPAPPPRRPDTGTARPYRPSGGVTVAGASAERGHAETCAPAGRAEAPGGRAAPPG